MLIKRTTLAALAIAMAVTPAASAKVAVDPPSTTASQAAAQVSTDGSRYAEIAAQRETIANRHWQLAENRPVVALSAPVSDGFDWHAALVGGVTPIVLLVLALLARPVLRRRYTAIAS